MASQDLIPLMGLLIPILTVTVSLGALIVWIVLGSRRRMHEADCRHKERMAAIEKGLLELPPEPPPPPPRSEQKPPHSRDLLRGLIWLGVGLAITFGGRDWWQFPLGGIGWIPVAVGAAYLIFHFVEARKASVPKHEEPTPGGDQAP